MAKPVEYTEADLVQNVRINELNNQVTDLRQRVRLLEGRPVVQPAPFYKVPTLWAVLRSSFFA